MTGPPLSDIASELVAARGAVGVVLGGSRARGTAAPDSDYDLGFYYKGDLDVPALQRVADQISSSPVTMTEPGGWGPWVNGGGWLTVDGWAVDIIYRDLDRVRTVWDDCRKGRYTVEIQAGHPLGFWSHAYAGEIAEARILEDRGELEALKLETMEYPAALRDALVSGLWEASFSVDCARKVIDRVGVAYIAGSLFRATGVVCHAIHGHERRWLINEKGAVAATGLLASAPVDFERRVGQVFSLLAPDAGALRDACEEMGRLVDETAALIE